MRARNGLKAAGLVAASALLIVVLTAAGLLAFIFYNMSAGRDWTAPSEKVSAALVEEAVDSLAQAKAMHDELEGLYNPHVDFDRVYQTAQAITDELTARL